MLREFLPGFSLFLVPMLEKRQILRCISKSEANTLFLTYVFDNIKYWFLYYSI